MLVSLFVGLLGVASAEEAPVTEEKDIFTVVDDAFGQYFVGPFSQCVVLGCYVLGQYLRDR